jgi:cell division protein ZapE
MQKTVFEIYQSELKQLGFHSDLAQLQAVAALDVCANEWARYQKNRSGVLSRILRRADTPKGCYLYGGVGRGKSFLMDCFFIAVPSRRKVRIHFHEFMRSVHSELHGLQGRENPLDILGKSIANKYELICFDEFHISDITDAMILYRLLVVLFNHNIFFVATSNFHPSNLYPDGVNRNNMLPAIELLNQRLTVINVDAGVDYRADFLQTNGCYFSPNNEAAMASMLKIFYALKDGSEENSAIQLGCRDVLVLKKAGKIIWFDFVTLCQNARSQNDYLELAEQYPTVLLSGVPKMTECFSNAARRFTWLIDIFYDRKIKCIISADVELEQLYTYGPFVDEFSRTISRLHEMRSQYYLNQTGQVVQAEKSSLLK